MNNETLRENVSNKSVSCLAVIKFASLSVFIFQERKKDRLIDRTFALCLIEAYCFQ